MKIRLVAFILLLFILTGCGAQEPTATTVPATAPAPELPGSSSFAGLGGTMPEMTFNTAHGETLTLSGLLEERQLVVLNFWYEDCPWCVREFPVMEVAYQNYREDVQIVALNPVDGAEAVKAYREKHGMSVTMAACSQSLARSCGVSSYPTSIFIDRDGVVCLIQIGAILSAEDWRTLFDAFTGDDYERKIYPSVEELLG